MVALIVVGVIASWFVWGFLVQEINSRRGFAGDWFLGGFLSIFVVPFGFLFGLKGKFDVFMNPVGYFNGLAGSDLYLAIGGLCTFLIPIIVLLIACLRPQGKE